MRKGQFLFSRLGNEMVLTAGAVPGQPIVEIMGAGRVLIENHLGVAAYGREQIVVKVRFGFISVCGCSLELMHMSKEQLVICGKIDAVTLQRRG